MFPFPPWLKAQVMVLGLFLAVQLIPLGWACLFLPLRGIETAAEASTKDGEVLWFGFVTTGPERNGIAPRSWAGCDDKVALVAKTAWLSWETARRPWWYGPGVDGYAVIRGTYRADPHGTGHLDIWPGEVLAPRCVVPPVPVLVFECSVLMVVTFGVMRRRGRKRRTQR